MIKQRRISRATWTYLSILCIFAMVYVGCFPSKREGIGIPRRSRERLVFQTEFGELEMVFYPEVAPRTVRHVLEVAKLGGYDTNHFFRVDKGFVAQVADVVSGRQLPLSQPLLEVASRNVVGEFSALEHRRGILSMARREDLNSATSSFSILLGPAPHLDGKYAVFGELVRGDEALSRMEELETVRTGIFVMPKKRVTILSSYVYDSEEKGAVPSS